MDKNLELLSIQMPDDASRTEVFNFWHANWKKTFQSIHDPSYVLFSDDFSRSHYAVVLRDSGQICGMYLLRSIDSGDFVIRHDSYFRHWSDENFERLQQFGRKVLIAKYFVVDSKYRGRDQTYSLKDYLLGIVAKTALFLNVDAVLGAARIDRGMHTTCYRWGAECLASQCPSGHGDYVDYILFTSQSQCHSDFFPLVSTIEAAWSIAIKTNAQRKVA